MILEIQQKNRVRKIEVTIKKTVFRLFEIMKNHIGSDNSISRDDLFYKVFGVRDTKINDLQYIVLWDLLRKAMHRCRQRTKCFITNYALYKSRMYFVVKSHEDAMHYSTIVKNTIGRLKSMEKRAFKSTQEEWYKDEWVY